MRKVWHALIAGLVLVLAACGSTSGNNGGNNTVGSESALDNVVASEAPVNKALLAMGQAALAQGMPIPVPVFLSLSPLSEPLTLDTHSWNCSGVVATGDLSDHDNDGIPANAKYSGNCSVTDNGQTATWKLNFNLKDNNDSDPFSGYVANGTITWEVVGQAKLVWAIDNHSVIRNSSGDYNLTYKGSWAYTDYTNATNDETVNYDFSGNWTPDPGNNPETWADVMSGPGTLNISGNFNGSCSDGGTFTVTLNSLNVHINASGCANNGNVNVNSTSCEGSHYSGSVSWSSCAGQ